MKMKFVFAAVVGLFLAASALAQKAPDFSGHWDLDLSKSKVDERARIQTMALDVAQTSNDIKIESKTTRAPRPEGAPAPGTGGGTGGGMGRGGGFGGGDSSSTYSLDGKETTLQQEGPNGPMPIKLKGKIEGGKLSLSRSSTFSGPNGEITISTKETWSLSADGKTLTVEREQSSPRGAVTSTLVFAKK